MVVAVSPSVKDSTSCTPEMTNSARTSTTWTARNAYIEGPPTMSSLLRNHDLFSSVSSSESSDFPKMSLVDWKRKRIAENAPKYAGTMRESSHGLHKSALYA